MRVFGTAADIVRASLNPVVNIGNWNMDTVDTIDVDVLIHYSRWRHICVMIISDAGDVIRRLGWKGSLSGWWSHEALKGDTILTLGRKIGGDFDHLDWSTTPFNRGFIKMASVP